METRANESGRRMLRSYAPAVVRGVPGELGVGARRRCGTRAGLKDESSEAAFVLPKSVAVRFPLAIGTRVEVVRAIEARANDGRAEVAVWEALNRGDVAGRGWARPMTLFVGARMTFGIVAMSLREFPGVPSRGGADGKEIGPERRGCDRCGRGVDHDRCGLRDFVVACCHQRWCQSEAAEDGG